MECLPVCGLPPCQPRASLDHEHPSFPDAASLSRHRYPSQISGLTPTPFAQATGVPLVDAFMKMESVEAASAASLKLVAAAFAGVVLGSLVLGAIERATGGQLGQSRDGGLHLAAAAAASVLKPAKASIGGGGAVQQLQPPCPAAGKRTAGRIMRWHDLGAAQIGPHGTCHTRLTWPILPCCKPPSRRSCFPFTASPTQQLWCRPCCKWRRSR